MKQSVLFPAGIGLLVVLFLSASVAFGAPAIDVSGATDAIGDGIPAANSIGTALVGLAAVFLIWRWVKGSLF